MKEAERLLAVGRETIPRSGANEVSEGLDGVFRDDMHERLSNFHARRLSKQFPKIIDRAVELELLTVDYEVPDRVRRYIEEASKAYLNGQWIACLIVCRSAIEFAVRDQLETSGYGSELDKLESQKGDSLFHLLELAKETMGKHRDPLEYAEEVRRRANRAVHADLPHVDECRDMYNLTRKIMQLLYRG